MSKEYLVKWEMEIVADSPEDAAREARTIQRDTEALCGYFEVIEVSDIADVTGVDLDILDGRF